MRANISSSPFMCRAVRRAGGSCVRSKIIGGSTLEAIEPARMKAGAFEAVMAKLDPPPGPQPVARPR